MNYVKHPLLFPHNFWKVFGCIAEFSSVVHDVCKHFIVSGLLDIPDKSCTFLFYIVTLRIHTLFSVCLLINSTKFFFAA